ncbi:MAG: YihA family ribosome biogenesis GTP-binding protein [Desulfobulbaceae bacterium]|jgi:GTP-binding protein|nr:YihA family ribosome biogenesis GTP-binding protein [Desulfobulbaceae bacterium]
MDFKKVAFLLSAYAIKQLPDPIYPDIAFAGRSNVGKSSLINRLISRTNLVKTSSKPGKTQSLNYFLVDESLFFVDLPGYGYAQVPQQTREAWRGLISEYIEKRATLACVIVIIDLRHELKALDRELIDYLRFHQRAYLPVYTKADKLTRNNQAKNAATLDAGLTITAEERIIFSAKTGLGCDTLQSRIAGYVLSRPVEVVE